MKLIIWNLSQVVLEKFSSKTFQVILNKRDCYSLVQNCIYMLYVVLLHISAQIIRSTDVKIAVTLYLYVDTVVSWRWIFSCLACPSFFLSPFVVVWFLAIPHTSMKFYNFYMEALGVTAQPCRQQTKLCNYFWKSHSFQLNLNDFETENDRIKVNFKISGSFLTSYYLILWCNHNSSHLQTLLPTSPA